MTIIYIIAGAIVLVVLWVIFAYNRFVSLVNQAKEAWSDIEIQLKRRYDLVPNLVATVKGYAAHEKSAFENVTRARAAALGAQSLNDKGRAEGELSQALKSIFAIAENYPDLKANQNFLALQSELSDTENKVQAARRFYNGTVRDLNIAIDSFPSNIIAGIFHYAKMEFFDLEGEAEAREPIRVNF